MGMRKALLFVTGIALAALPVRGAPIVYGNYPGTTLTFQSVTETSSTDPGVPLFGAPSNIGDTLAFSPTNFGIQSANGTGAKHMDSTLTMNLAANPGFGIHSFSISEAGDYSLAGP